MRKWKIRGGIAFGSLILLAGGIGAAKWMVDKKAEEEMSVVQPVYGVSGNFYN